MQQHYLLTVYIAEKYSVYFVRKCADEAYQLKVEYSLIVGDGKTKDDLTSFMDYSVRCRLNVFLYSVLPVFIVFKERAQVFEPDVNVISSLTQVLMHLTDVYTFNKPNSLEYLRDMVASFRAMRILNADFISKKNTRASS